MVASDAAAATCVAGNAEQAGRIVRRLFNVVVLILTVVKVAATAAYTRYPKYMEYASKSSDQHQSHITTRRMLSMDEEKAPKL